MSENNLRTRVWWWIIVDVLLNPFEKAILIPSCNAIRNVFISDIMVLPTLYLRMILFVLLCNPPKLSFLHNLFLSISSYCMNRSEATLILLIEWRNLFWNLGMLPHKVVYNHYHTCIIWCKMDYKCIYQPLFCLLPLNNHHSFTGCRYQWR